MPVPRGAHLLLVDDIMTTQASARRCAALLLAAGADRIDVAVVGRTIARPEVVHGPEDSHNKVPFLTRNS
jgi:orotate phosphoribosyltransferase